MKQCNLSRRSSLSRRCAMVILRTLAPQILWHTLRITVASAKKLGCALLLCHVTSCQLASWTLHRFDAVKATRFAARLQAYFVNLVEAWQRHCGRPVADQWLEANSTSHRWVLHNHNALKCKKQSLGPKHFTDGWDTHHTDMIGHCNYFKIHKMKTIAV